MQNIATNYSIKIEILDSNKSQAGDIIKDNKEKDEKNIYVPIADLYSYTITIISMYWREKDVTNCLQSLALSYLYHFLRIADNASILTTHNNYYNLNLLDTNSRNSLIFGISTRITTNIINI